MSSSASSLVLYGSETGNALDAAEDVAAMARRLRFAVQLRPMDDVAAVRAAVCPCPLCRLVSDG